MESRIRSPDFAAFAPNDLALITEAQYGVT